MYALPEVAKIDLGSSVSVLFYSVLLPIVCAEILEDKKMRISFSLVSVCCFPKRSLITNVCYIAAYFISPVSRFTVVLLIKIVIILFLNCILLCKYALYRLRK